MSYRAKESSHCLKPLVECTNNSESSAYQNSHPILRSGAPRVNKTVFEVNEISKELPVSFAKEATSGSVAPAGQQRIEIDI